MSAVVGDSEVLTFALIDSGGAVQTGEVANLSVVSHLNGATIDLSPSLAEISTSGYYTLSFNYPSSVGRLRIEVKHSGSYTADVSLWEGDVTVRDIDGLGLLLQQSSGTISPLSADDTDLGDIVEGDSYASGSLEIPLAKISRFGYADLTGMTVTAAIKDEVGKTPIESSSAPNFFAAIDNASTRLVSIGWDTWPTDLDLESTESDHEWFIDVQLKHTADARIITGLRLRMRVVWQREDRT